MGRGCIYRRNKTWSIQYDLGPDEETGARRLGSKGGYATRQEAEAALIARLAEVAGGRHVKASRQTFAGYAAHWLDTIIRDRVRPSSLERYREQVEYHLIPTIGTVKLQAFTPHHARRALAAAEKKGLGQSGRRELHARLKQILRSAAGDGLLAANPMASVKAPQVQPTEMRVWTAAQLDAFLTATRGTRFGLLWHVYAMTGMRRGEALGLRWKDVDWGRPSLAVRQQIVRRPDNRPVAGAPKTKAGNRTIGIGPATVAVLREQRKVVAALQLAAQVWEDHDLVFPFRGGIPWRPDVISHYFPDAIADANAAGLDLPVIRLHDLRHTHASILLAEDGNIKLIAARLGHDPAVLLRTYAHILPTSEDRAIARLEAAVLGASTRIDAAASQGSEISG